MNRMIRTIRSGRGVLVRGFTLIEVLVGLSILTAGVLAIMAIFPVLLRTQAEAEMLTIAASLAQMKAEEIRRDDDRNGSLVTAIRNLTEPTTPLVFPHERRLTYSFSGRSLRYGSVDASDPRGSDGVARVIIRYAPDFRPSQDVVYEFRFN
jgi:prepilin-type N-terminal cleavage/methylation domain-containing protein